MNKGSSLRQPGLLVYLSGVGTSFLALWCVDMLNERGENVMGWYVNYIIPAGALLVGIASGLGYAIGARVLNVKLTMGFVAGMFTTGLIDYVAAQWVTYSNLIERLRVPADKYSFLSYLREICEGMSFKKSGSTEAGSTLGVFGYVFKFLEMLGFSLGTMIPCAILRGIPYCTGCQRYLKKHTTAGLYSPVLTTSIKALPRAEREGGVKAAVDAVTGRAVALLQSVAQMPLEQTLAALSGASEANIKKSTAWVRLTLYKCPHCNSHHVAVQIQFVAANGKQGHGTLPPLDKTSGFSGSGFEVPPALGQPPALPTTGGLGTN